MNEIPSEWIVYIRMMLWVKCLGAVEVIADPESGMCIRTCPYLCIFLDTNTHPHLGATPRLCSEYGHIFVSHKFPFFCVPFSRE